MGEHGVLAGAQPEDLLQDLHALPHRMGAGIRPEIAVAAVGGAAIEGQPREHVSGQDQIRIGLVVAEEDVVARRLGLDEVVLQQQGLGLGARHRDRDVAHARDHEGDARREVRLLEIARHPLLQVARLAHVEQLPVLAQHAIHARQAGQARKQRRRVEGRVVYDAHNASSGLATPRPPRFSTCV